MRDDGVVGEGMVKRVIRVFCSGLGMVIFGGCATPIETTSTSLPGVDFSRFKTFSWVAGTGRGSVTEERPYLTEQIRSAVAGRLRAAGLEEVAQGAGDLEVSYTVLARDAYETQAFQNVGGSTVGAYQYDNFSIEPLNITTDTNLYRKATLAINLLDRSTGQMVWRGRAKAKLFENAPQGPAVAKSRVDLAVVRMFEGFPPEA
ncbi:MAG: DUF4136 domain-containing protein [Verrucomicrobiota bacterium]